MKIVSAFVLCVCLVKVLQAKDSYSLLRVCLLFERFFFFSLVLFFLLFFFKHPSKKKLKIYEKRNVLLFVVCSAVSSFLCRADLNSATQF